ncbi:MAG: hypothetical protein KC983_00865 [Phycisphaerales bacterium]|nr:hypothetical protein [Phycisphaerales bacterium]
MLNVAFASMHIATLRFDALPYGPMTNDTGVTSLQSPWMLLLFVLLAASVATAIAGAVVWSWRQYEAKDGPIVARLARQFGLSTVERRFIIRLARNAEVRHPATLLISVGCYQHAVGRFEKHHGPAPMARTIARKIFAA